MKDRCLNKRAQRYSDYGGRGISICNEWLEFTNFYSWAMLNGYSDSLSIDRNNNNGNYEPNNCRWATSLQQSNNRRDNSTVLAVSPDGTKYIVKSLSKFMEEYNLTRSKVYNVLRGDSSSTKGWHFKYMKKGRA